MTAAIGSRIARGAAWSAVESWGRHVFTFAIVVVLARQLGAEEFGLAALAMIAPIVLAVPVTSGVPEALIQRPHVEPEHLDSAFWLLVSVGFAISGLIWLAATPIARALDEPRLPELVRWASVIVVLQSFGSVPAAVLKRRLDFRLFAIRTTIGTAVGGTIGIALALSGYGVWSLIFMQICKVSVESAVLLGWGAWRPRLRFSLDRCRDLFDFAGPLTIQSMWNFVNDELPKAIVAVSIGTQAVGLLAFARRPLEFLTQCFLGPVTAVTLPAVSRLQAEPDKINDFYVKAVRLGALVGFPVFVGFAAVAPEAVPLVFGPQWTQAVPAVQLLMLLGLVRIVDGTSGLSLLALGHSRLLLKMNMLYTVSVVLALPVAAKFGLEAAVAGLVLCNLALLPVFFHYANRVGGIDVRPALATFPRLAICAASMVAAIELFRSAAPADASAFLVLSGEIALGGATFATAAALLLPGELRSAAAVLLRLRT
jgi:O-antigen/teichoic acid export membrane protein